MTTTCTFGFRVLGPATGDRRLVDAGAAFAAYAACEDKAQVNREAYLSAFQFASDFGQYLDAEGTTRGFDGVCWAPWLWFDVDRADLETALSDTRKLAKFLVKTYGVDKASLLAFFSGSKGFHLGMPTSLWGPDPSTSFHRVARQFAESIAQAAGVEIDVGVYDKVRLFRAPNSRHPKTGWHKRRLSFNELRTLSFDAVVERAEKPAPFDLPEPAVRNERAVADWSAAMAAVGQQVEAKAQMRAAGTVKLNRSTLEFITKGASQGDRHRLLFSAAANLTEFGCPAALAHALLTEQGLDCGLSPSEVKRQIDCGLNHLPVGPAANAASPSPAPPEPPELPPPELPKSSPDLAIQLAALWKLQPAEKSLADSERRVA